MVRNLVGDVLAGGEGDACGRGCKEKFWKRAIDLLQGLRLRRRGCIWCRWNIELFGVASWRMKICTVKIVMCAGEGDESSLLGER